MSIRERQYYKQGERLMLRREKSRNYEEWEILSKIDEGATAVCYAARSGAKRGRLKAYSPLKGEENNNQNLESFVAAYRILDEIKYRDPRFEVLNNYIAYHEILYSSDSQGGAKGAFVWTPDDKSGIEFSKYLEALRKNDKADEEESFKEILETVATLTDCICILHLSGILHLDLKPSNFLVSYDSRKKLSTGNISLFDINTIYSIENEKDMAAGSLGYCAPEVFRGITDNRSDIYSIGAILFNAVADYDVYPDGLYRDEYYEHLNELPDNSGILREIKAKKGAAPVQKFTEILKLALAENRNDRYEYAELLLEDIRALIDILKNGREAEAAASERADKKSRTVKTTDGFGSKFLKWAGLLCGTVLLVILGIMIERNLFGGKKEAPDNSLTQVDSASDTINDASINDASVSDASIGGNESTNDNVYASFEKMNSFMQNGTLGSRFETAENIVVPWGTESIIPEDKVLVLGEGAKLIFETVENVSWDTREAEEKASKLLVYGKVECYSPEQLEFGAVTYGDEENGSVVLVNNGAIVFETFSVNNASAGTYSNGADSSNERMVHLRGAADGLLIEPCGDLIITGNFTDEDALSFFTSQRANRVILNNKYYAIDNKNGKLTEPRFADYIERLNGEDSGEEGSTRVSINRANNIHSHDYFEVGENDVRVFTKNNDFESCEISSMKVEYGGTLVFEDKDVLNGKFGNEMWITFEAGSRFIVGDLIIDIPIVANHLLKENYARLAYYKDRTLFEIWGRCKVRGTSAELVGVGPLYDVKKYALVTYNPGIEFEAQPGADFEYSLNELNRLQSEMEYASWLTDKQITYVMDKDYEINDGEIFYIPNYILLKIDENATLTVHPGGKISYEWGGDILNKNRICFSDE